MTAEAIPLSSIELARAKPVSPDFQHFLIHSESPVMQHMTHPEVITTIEKGIRDEFHARITGRNLISMQAFHERSPCP